MAGEARHSPYFDLLENLKGEGCLICRMVKRSVSRYLDSVSYESVTDVAVRERLRAANGLCRRHGRQFLEETRDPLGLAIIERDVAENLLRRLAEASGEALGERRKRSLLAPFARPAKNQPGRNPVAPRGDCPACQVQGEAETRFIDTLVEYLERPEVADAFEREGRLCLPHFGRALVRMARGETYDLLLRRQRTILRAIADELAEYERKSDYRFRHEALGPERDAPARAAALITGDY